VRVATSVSIGYLSRTTPERELPVDAIFEPVFVYESLLDSELEDPGGV
jgi:hypothetical protein